jgi:hypothetical protein
MNSSPLALGNFFTYPLAATFFSVWLLPPTRSSRRPSSSLLHGSSMPARRGLPWPPSSLNAGAPCSPPHGRVPCRRAADPISQRSPWRELHFFQSRQSSFHGAQDSHGRPALSSHFLQSRPPCSMASGPALFPHGALPLFFPARPTTRASKAPVLGDLLPPMAGLFFAAPLSPCSLFSAQEARTPLPMALGWPGRQPSPAIFLPWLSSSPAQRPLSHGEQPSSPWSWFVTGGRALHVRCFAQQPRCLRTLSAYCFVKRSEQHAGMPVGCLLFCAAPTSSSSTPGETATILVRFRIGVVFLLLIVYVCCFVFVEERNSMFGVEKKASRSMLIGCSELCANWNLHHSYKHRLGSFMVSWFMSLSIDLINKLYRCGRNVSVVGRSMVVFMISS